MGGGGRCAGQTCPRVPRRVELSCQVRRRDTALGMLKCTPAEPLTVNERLRPPRFPQASHTVSRFITPGPEVCLLPEAREH